MKRFLISLVLLLFCSPALDAQSRPAREENSLRIMSYNVHNCVGVDKKRDFDRIAGVIDDCAPDVVALQELDSMTVRHRRYVLGEIAVRTGMYATYAPAIKILRGRYGVGLLSKEKPVAVKRIPLPGKEEKRVLLMVEFDRYVVLCTHFSLTEHDRLTSARIVVDAVEGIEKPVFLAGDMNALPDSETVEILGKRFTMLSDPGQGTYPSEPEPKECIDHIYGSGRLVSLGSRVVNEPVASDHRPVWVDVRLND